MRKFFTAIALCAMTFTVSATDYVLDPAALYADILNGVNTNVKPAVPKYEFTDHVVSSIFTVYSPSTRMMRIDLASASENVLFADGTEATHRLEPNGATNTTNGRIIYINCPSAGTLTVYAWTATAGRGYTVNGATEVGIAPGAMLYDTNTSMSVGVQPYPEHTYAIAAPGIVALVPNAGFYYGKIKFSDSAAGVESLKQPASYQLLPTGIRVEGTTTKVQIYNLAGRLIKESTEQFVSINDLSKGVYLLEVMTDGNKSSVKMMR